MANSIRGDDDVLALLNEMTGVGGGSAHPSSPTGNTQQKQLPSRDHPNTNNNGGNDDDTISRNNQPPPSLFATTLAAAHRQSPPSNPHVEIIRHRCHEKFKANFYEVFRSCSGAGSSSKNNNQAATSLPSNDTSVSIATTAGIERNQYIRSTIHSIWKSMPPHSIWERFQFSLKTLEGDCVRESIESDDYTPPWCHANKNGKQLLHQLVCPTVHQIHSWIVNGRCSGTVWEPLLPVPFISSFSTNSSEELQQINQRYRQGTLALLREEIKFQFRRTFKQQLSGGGKLRNAKGNDQVPLSIDKIFVSLRDTDEAASNDVGTKSKKAKKEKKKHKGSSRDDKQDANDEHKSINREEFILQTIFQSNQFQKITQKLHKKFHYIAEEGHSAFLSDLQKCSNRLTLEEQRRLGGGGGKRKKGKHKNGSGAMPKITFLDNNDDSRVGSKRGNDVADSRDHQMMVTFAGISLKINEMHKSKLHSLYQSMLRNMMGHHNRDDDRYEEYLEQFPKLLFAILLRYDALEGAGLQSAIPSTVFRYLHERFGCELECFASPFNCWLEKSANGGGRSGGRVLGGNYGSAFGDTDALFGSFGSFFGMDFLKIAEQSGGSCFQANPPFASEFIERMCHRMHQLLDVSNRYGEDGGNSDGKKKVLPLMFVIFVPAWSESNGWKTLSSSPHLKKHVLLSQKDDVHYYAEGTQYRRAMDGKGNHRVASFDTSVFFLQNDAAREKWPLSDDVDDGMLKTAFAMSPLDGEDGKGAVCETESAQQLRAEKKTLQAPQTQKQHRQNEPITPSAKGEKKKKRSNDKTKGASKKKKLMNGVKDEMSILASMGILDKGDNAQQSVDDGALKVKSNLATAPKGSTGSKKKKKRRRK